MRVVPLLVATLTLDVGAFAGTAYAYFMTSGTGTNNATLGPQPQAVAVLRATVASGDLYPGGKGGLSLELTNPNHFAVALAGVSEAGLGTTVTVTPSTASCSAAGAGVSVSATVAAGLRGYAISPHTTGTTTLTVATGAAMSSGSPNACQTKSFDIKVTVRVDS